MRFASSNLQVRKGLNFKRIAFSRIYNEGLNLTESGKRDYRNNGGTD